jgi:hypothetical protein
MKIIKYGKVGWEVLGYKRQSEKTIDYSLIKK